MGRIIPYIVENNDHDWLVIEPTPLKNMSSSVGMMTFPIYGKITSVPNHQPDFYDIVMIYDREHEMFFFFCFMGMSMGYDDLYHDIIIFSPTI